MTEGAVESMGSKLLRMFLDDGSQAALVTTRTCGSEIGGAALSVFPRS